MQNRQRSVIKADCNNAVTARASSAIYSSFHYRIECGHPINSGIDYLV